MILSPCYVVSPPNDSAYIADCNATLQKLHKLHHSSQQLPCIDPADTLIHDTYFDTLDEINITRADPGSFNESIDVIMTYLRSCKVDCNRSFKWEE